MDEHLTVRSSKNSGASKVSESIGSL